MYIPNNTLERMLLIQVRVFAHANEASIESELHYVIKVMGRFIYHHSTNQPLNTNRVITKEKKFKTVSEILTNLM